MNIFIKYLRVLGIAALPIIELRGAVPYGVSADLPLIPVVIVSVLGNMLPVPFIIVFIRQIFVWMKKKSVKLCEFAEKLEARAYKKGALLVRYEMLGLFILVAVPLPGTGAWTGALIAALFDLRLKNAIPVILSGVVTAGIIISIITYGIDMLI